ncbi:MAG: ABC transporter substrate-binding protein [Promethearchaeota archaeon]|jgi:ABC-type transport system substrate-binding protein
MKKTLTTLAFLLVITSIILPVIPLVVAQEEEVPPYRIATYAPNGDWDEPIDPGWSLESLYFIPVMGQGFFNTNYDFQGGTKNGGDVWAEYYPTLATDWVVEYWPEEMNDKGFINTGGVRSVEYTLRENVTFHDGSDWNATVAKWNIDRLYLIVGNLTGNGDLRNFDYYFPEVLKSEPYWTTSWNLSRFDDLFAGYYIGNTTSYSGVNTIDIGDGRGKGWVFNPNPYGGLDPLGAPIFWAPYDRHSIIDYVEITESKQSGGKLKVYWNTWNSYQSEGHNFDMISYKAYAKNYTGNGIYGRENGVKDPRNPTVVDRHMIGTGPYEYIETTTEDGGYIQKYEGYWNKTALEATGVFDIERVEFVNFPSSEAGGIAMNNALLSHAVDGAIDQSGTMALDSQRIKDDPNINYWPSAPSVYLDQITLNCINETYWAWPWAQGYSSYLEGANSDINGQPQVLRKALSYAFDYDHLIDIVLEGKAVRQQGIVGAANLYANASVPLADFNVTYARELLLTTENDTSGKVYTSYHSDPYPFGGYSPSIELYNFSKRCADRGLTASSTDAEWQAVAESGNPVWEIDFYWAAQTEPNKGEFLRACNRLGVALTDPDGITNRVPQRIWDVIQLYWVQTFATGKSIWSAGAWPMPYYMAATTPEAWLEFMMRDPNEGRWRTQGAAGIISPWWPKWNFGFGYDDRFQELMDRIWMSSPDLKLKFISQMADLQQNELYPYIYAYQGQGANVIWDCWEAPLYNQTRTGIITGWWGFAGGMYSYANINYKGCPVTPPLIPGYSLLVTVSAISILGLCYIIIKKKKLS